MEHNGVLTGFVIVGGFPKHKTIISFLLEIMLDFYLPSVFRLILHNGEKLLPLAPLTLLNRICISGSISLLIIVICRAVCFALANIIYRCLVILFSLSRRSFRIRGSQTSHGRFHHSMVSISILRDSRLRFMTISI